MFCCCFFLNRKNSKGNSWSLKKNKGGWKKICFVFLGIFVIIIIWFIQKIDNYSLAFCLCCYQVFQNKTKIPELSIPRGFEIVGLFPTGCLAYQWTWPVLISYCWKPCILGRLQFLLFKKEFDWYASYDVKYFVEEKGWSLERN